MIYLTNHQPKPFLLYRYSHIPFLRISISFAFGIIISGLSSTFIISLSLLFFIAASTLLQPLLYKKISNFNILLSGSFTYITIILFGAFISSYNDQLTDSNHFSNIAESKYMQAIAKSVNEKENSYSIEAEVLSCQDSLDNWTSTTGKILIYIKKDASTQMASLGDILLIPTSYTRIDGPKNPNEFAYKDYLARRYIHHKIYLSTKDFSIIKNNNYSIDILAENTKNKIQNIFIEYGIKGNTLAVASALMIGDKSLLQEDTYESYASAGALHILAVSGLHVGIIYIILNGLLSLIFRSEKVKNYKLFLIIVFLWSYAFITGLSASVVRASTMFTLIAIGTIINNKANIYNTICSSAFIILLFNPNYLFEVGFQLSYLAVIGIIYLYPKIYNSIYFNNYLLRKIWSITAVSLAAQIATFPISIMYFHQFPTYFSISNLIVIPAAAAIMYLGITLLAFSSFELIAKPISSLLRFVIENLNVFVSWIRSLPNSVIENIYLSESLCIILYLIIISMILLTVQKKIKYITRTLALILLVVGIVQYQSISYRQKDYLCVYDIRKTSAINLISDDYNYILLNPKYEFTSNKHQYQVANNWVKHGGRQAMLKSISDLPKDGFNTLDNNIINIGGKSIVVIDSDTRYTFKTPLKVDYLILSRHKNMNIQSILKNYIPREIIIDSSYPIYKVEKIIEKIPTGISVHSTAKSGGYEVCLNE